MKKIILLILLFVSFLLPAQTTYEVMWESGAGSATLSPVIEVGDTVKWIWTDSAPKTITALPGGREVFDSGILEVGTKVFSYTFNKIGQTRYENEANPSMNGRVTVVKKMSQEEKFVKNLSFYPNPVNTTLHLSSVFTIENYEIYNVLGSLVLKGKSNSKLVRINMNNLNSGLYFVKISANNMHTTLKVTKS